MKEMLENIQTRLIQMYEIDRLLFLSFDFPKFQLAKKKDGSFITQAPNANKK
jgi:hypothetical protein